MWWLFWVGYGVVGLVAAKIFYHTTHDANKNDEEWADATLSLFFGACWGLFGPILGLGWLSRYWFRVGEKSFADRKADKATRQREKREAKLKAERLNWLGDK